MDFARFQSVSVEDLQVGYDILGAFRAKGGSFFLVQDGQWALI